MQLTLADIIYSSMFTPDLERLARMGDVKAQDELTERAMQFATSCKNIKMQESLTNDEMAKEFK